MITLQSADKALKTVYLDVLQNQLNLNANAFLAKIKNSTKDVWGKEVRKAAPIGINGGIGAGTEDGLLPEAAGNNYLQFVSSLKNLYGTIELSDKAIRASENNAGAFVNLLNDEMEGLIKAATFNFGRMLYGDGTGELGEMVDKTTAGNSFKLHTGVKNIIEGMVVDIYDDANFVQKVRVIGIDRSSKLVYVNASVAVPAGTARVYVAGSKDNELTGLKAIFDTSKPIYGVDRGDQNFCLNPYSKTSTEITDSIIQDAVDAVEEQNGSTVDFIVCSTGVRKKYQEHLATYKRNIDVMELQGGYKAISFGGVPVLADRFCPEGTMYLLNSKKFTVHQLCDWRWLEGDGGRVIKQQEGKPTYSATLVKYAELICDLPGGQARICGIQE